MQTRTIKFFMYLLVLLLFPGLVMAASLEEKVESLEKTVVQQQEQIDALTKEQESSGSLFKNDKVMISLYGQINRAVLVANDGNDTEFYSVDNAQSSTRFGLKGEAKAFDGITLGTWLEMEYRVNPSSKVNQNDKSGIDDGLVRRHVDIYVNFDKFGKVSLGHGSTASDGVSEADLSGTTVIGNSDIPLFSGGQYFYNGTSDSLTTTTIGNVFNNFDGLGRESRVRYDTPSFVGVVLSASVISGGGYDAALRYELSKDTYELKAATAYAHHENGSDIFNGSVSLLLNSGWNFSVAAGMKDFDTAGRDEGEFFYGKVGYIFNVFSIGKSACSADMGLYKNVARNGDDATVDGIQMVQSIDKWNTEVYAGFRNHNLDRSNLENINALMSGVRVKF